jgi:hypothetical protein
MLLRSCVLTLYRPAQQQQQHLGYQLIEAQAAK